MATVFPQPLLEEELMKPILPGTEILQYTALNTTTTKHLTTLHSNLIHQGTFCHVNVESNKGKCWMFSG